MTAMLRIPRRSEARAVLIVAHGMGWRVGIGPIATGEIDGAAAAHMSPRDAEAAALALADANDLMALRA